MNIEKNKLKYLFKISLLFAIAYVICLHKNFFGVGCFAFGIVSAIILFCVIKKRDIKVNHWHLFYGLAGVILSAIPMLFKNEFCVSVSKLLYVILMIKWVFTIYFRKEKMEFVRNINMYFSFVLESIGQILSPFIDLPVIMSKDNNNKKYKNINIQSTNMQNASMQNNSVQNNYTKQNKSSQIVIGIIMAFPVLFVVLCLLLSADAVFRSVVFNILENMFMGVDNFVSLIRWFIVLGLSFIAIYSMGKALLIGRLKTEPVRLNKSDNITGVTFTIIFAVLYVVFCLVQIIALLNTSGSILPSGITYASYARQGFFQLLFVCIINVIMVLVCKLKFEDGRTFRKLMMVICVCTYIMIGSSAYRMILYIRNYQLTFLRILVLWTLIVIAVVMSFVTVFIYNEKIHLFEYILISITVLFIAFSFMSPDRIIAEYNINHMSKSSNTDVNYLINELSEDASAIIIENIDKIENNANKDNKRNYSEDWEIRYCEKLTDNYENNCLSNILSFNVSEYLAYIKAKEYLDN